MIRALPSAAQCSAAQRANGRREHTRDRSAGKRQQQGHTALSSTNRADPSAQTGIRRNQASTKSEHGGAWERCSPVSGGDCGGSMRARSHDFGTLRRRLHQPRTAQHHACALPRATGQTALDTLSRFRPETFNATHSTSSHLALIHSLARLGSAGVWLRSTRANMRGEQNQIGTRRCVPLKGSRNNVEACRSCRTSGCVALTPHCVPASALTLLTSLTVRSSAATSCFSFSKWRSARSLSVVRECDASM